MADDIVQAYLEHDKKNYEKSADCFALVYRELFPRTQKDKILHAAQAYTSALRNHDLVEDGGHRKPAQLNHNGWKLVESNLQEMCKALDIPESYANETTDFFRHHGVRDFIRHKLTMLDKIPCPFCKMVIFSTQDQRRRLDLTQKISSFMRLPSNYMPYRI